MSLTQAEADYLMQLEKKFTSDDPLILGPGPLKCVRTLISGDRREQFLLDVHRGSLSLNKYTFQERARVIIPLVRVDIGETLRHTNPDGEPIQGSHIHIYREGYDVKFAWPLDRALFRAPEDMIMTFEDFARFCNITMIPPIEGRLI
jgi:hypothetical protein